MNLLPEDVNAYIRELHNRLDEPVLLEMEALAEERGFPIVGRMVGTALEMLARSIDAERVFELGSGFGYSAYWFSRAVGPTGQVTLTDTDADNTRKSKDFLERAGLAAPCRFLTQSALEALQASSGEFDIVYCDINKEDYPEAFALAADKLRVGGLYLCDNVLWSGKVADPENDDTSTQAIRVHNKAVFADDRFLTTIIPIRDGVISALKIG